MAKHTTPKIQDSLRGINIPRLISHADISETLPAIYSNHVQISMNQSEFIMDYFRLAPDPLDPTKLKATYLQRVIIPASLTKRLISIMDTTTTSFDEDLKEALKAIQDQALSSENQQANQ